jgi:hypothetical protein
LLLNVYFQVFLLEGYGGAELLAVSNGIKLPVLHSFTKSRRFFSKAIGWSAVKWSNRVALPNKRERAPDLFYEITTSVEGEALWLSVSIPTSPH